MTSHLIRARAFAHTHHMGQTYGPLPYTAHLRAVSDVLHEFGWDRVSALQTGRRDVVELHMAAWLHDILEDTDVSFVDLEATFGVRVATLVYAVTDEPGETRTERKVRTYPKIRRHGAAAVALKLADRIANVRSSRQRVPRLYHRYRAEQPEFVTALRKPGEWDAMWGHLDYLIEVLPAALRPEPPLELEQAA